MKLVFLLYPFIAFLAIFFVINIFIIIQIYKFKFAGPLVKIIIPTYLLGLLLIILYSYGSLGAIDWSQKITLTNLKFW